MKHSLRNLFFHLSILLLLGILFLSACQVVTLPPTSPVSVQETGSASEDCTDPNAPCLLPTYKITPTFPAELPNPAGQQSTGIERVEVESAKLAYDDGSAVFLDVRSEAAYTQKHISGSLNIPLEQIEERISELNPEAWIITYCT